MLTKKKKKKKIFNPLVFSLNKKKIQRINILQKKKISKILIL